jgi:hypothetical protein
MGDARWASDKEDKRRARQGETVTHV